MQHILSQSIRRVRHFIDAHPEPHCYPDRLSMLRKQYPLHVALRISRTQEPYEAEAALSYIEYEACVKKYIEEYTIWLQGHLWIPRIKSLMIETKHAWHAVRNLEIIQNYSPFSYSLIIQLLANPRILPVHLVRLFSTNFLLGCRKMYDLEVNILTLSELPDTCTCTCHQLKKRVKRIDDFFTK